MSGFEVIYPEDLTRKEVRTLDLAIELSNANESGLFSLEEITNLYHERFKDKKTENSFSSMAKSLREISIKVSCINDFHLYRQSKLGRGFSGIYGWRKIVRSVNREQKKAVLLAMSKSLTVEG